VKFVIPVGSLHVGGGCRVLADVANMLSKAGHDVTVVIPEEMPIDYHLHCRVKRVPYLGKEHIPYGDIVLPNFYTTFQPAYEAWPKQCVRLSLGFEPYWVPDVENALWTYAQGVPIISISHWLDDQIYQHVGQRSQVVNLGINRSIFHAKRRPKKRSRKVILYLARDPEAGYELKGYQDFVNAMHILKRIYHRKFTVYMICPERILPLPGIAHRTFQPKNDHEIAHLYRIADVFVSSSWFEGFALPPLEAMSCGTPVVTTDSGGVMDFCAHLVNCYITTPKDPEGLAIGVKRILNSRSLKIKMMRRGRVTAAHHTKHHFEADIVHALERIHRHRTHHQH